MKLAKCMSRLGTETAFEVLARAKALEAQGREIVHLEIGEPDFDTPKHIIEAACKALHSGYTHYTPSAGIPELRQAIAEEMSRTRGIPVQAENVVVTPGGKPIMFYTILALAEPGDEVIYPNPGFPIYESMINFTGAKPVPIPLREEYNFAFDIDEFKKLVTRKTKLIIINSPHNPTGGILDKETLEEIAKIAMERDIAVLSDEIYDRILYDGEFHSIASIPGMQERTIILNGFSKTYAMTGWRVGWAVAKGDLLKPVAAINRTAIGYVNNIAQRAALAALTDEAEDRKWRAWMLAQYEAQRKAMWEQLAEIPGVHVYEPEAAFYAWIRYEAPLSAVEMMKYLYERGLNVRPGTEFGAMGEQHLRFTFAPSVETITAGVAIFKAAMEELRAG